MRSGTRGFYKDIKYIKGISIMPHDDDDNEEEDDDKMEDNNEVEDSNRDDNNFKDISALELDRERGFS